MTKVLLIGVMIGLAVALLAGTSSAAVSEQAIQDLYKAAKAEGEVIWQWGGTERQIAPVVKAFEAKYPGIKCSPFSFSATSIPTRVITEAAARNLTLDVGCTMTDTLLALLKRDLLVKTDWTKTSDGDPSLILADGAFVLIHDHPPCWVYNTKLVSKAEAPKTWEDVLDPKWKGSKISMRSLGSAFGGLFPEWRVNPQKVVGFVERLKRQEVMQGKRYSEVINRVATGECPIGIVVAAEVSDLQKKGAPLAVCSVSPTGGIPMGAFIPKGSPHPNAAKLLVSWLSSNEGRKIFTKLTDFGLAYPPEASPLAQLLTEAGIKYHRVASMEDVADYLRFTEVVVKTMAFLPE